MSSPRTSDSSQVCPVPKTWKEIASLNMRDLRRVLASLQVPVTGRVTKVDLQYALCKRLKISTTGGCSAGDLDAIGKASIPPEVMPFYLEVGPLAHVWFCEGRTSCRRGVPPSFDRKMITDYLVNSPDKSFDGESMRSYKALRAYQLFEERHVHDIEFCPSWPRKDAAAKEESMLCFVRCKCNPSQDTAKQPYRVVVCLDKRSGRPYGAHCRCVSGLGEACSHIAGLFFALEDFISRGFVDLPDGKSTTEMLCAWSKPAGSQKVEAQPLSKVPIKKAVAGGRKRKTSWERSYHISKYDPRQPRDRKLDLDAVARLSSRLKRSINDCGFVRNWEDTHYDTQGRCMDLPEPVLDLPESALSHDKALSVGLDVEVSTDASSNVSASLETLIKDRQMLLFSTAGTLPLNDSELIQELDKHVKRVEDELRLSASARDDLEQATRSQSTCDRWHVEHVGRITASSSHRVLTASRSKSCPDHLIRDIMKYQVAGNKTSLRPEDPRSHGLRLEPIARQAYVAQKAAESSPVSVEDRGLFVSLQFPFLATSTDGLISPSSASDKGILEIKCPVSTKSISDLASTRKYFCLKKMKDGSLRLRKSHSYYTQVQFEMAVTGVEWCDFVVFTQQQADNGHCGNEDDECLDYDLFVERVPFSSGFWNESLLPA